MMEKVMGLYCWFVDYFLVKMKVVFDMVGVWLFDVLDVYYYMEYVVGGVCVLDGIDFLNFDVNKGCI